MSYLIFRATLIGLCLWIGSQQICTAQNVQNSDWFLRGETKYKAGQWSEAISCFSEAIFENPRDKNAYYFRGDALRQSGKLFEAIKDLRTVTQMDPLDSEAWRSLGKAYRVLGRFRDELTYYEKSISCAKPEKRRELENWRSKIQQKLRQSSKGGISNQTNSLIEKAQAALQSGHLDDAINLYEAGLNFAPGDSAIYLSLADVYLLKGDKIRTMQFLEKALILDPMDTKAEARFASFHEKYSAETIESSTESKTNQSAEEFKNMSNIAEQAQDWDQAIYCYRKAAELNPMDPGCHYNLGIIYEIKGDWETAAHEYKDALRLESDHLEALLALGEIHSIFLDDHKAALEYYEKAMNKTEDKALQEKIAKRIQTLQRD